MSARIAEEPPPFVPPARAGERDDLIGMIGHDLKTPLNGLLGFLELLGRTSLDADQRDCLDTAVHCVRRLDETLNGILDMARAGAGELPLREEMVNLRDELRSSVGFFQLEARNRGLGFRIAVDPDAPEEFRVDRIKFRQILSNLLSNAVKFCDKGGIFIKAEGVSLPEGEFVRTTVRDTGIGISERHLHEVFDAFQRGANQGSPDYRGTGLGLAIVKRLVEAMKGRIAIHSREGAGTEVVLELPRGGAMGPGGG